MKTTRLIEEYRPKFLKDIVGQDDNIASIKSILERAEGRTEDLPHFLFAGATPGTGKSSTAMAMAREIWGEDWSSHFKELNASDDRGIAVIRNEVKQIVAHKGNKMLFLTEADHLTEDAQAALRRIMEKARGTVFVLDGNNLSKIIGAIQSRCAVYVFKRLEPTIILKRLLQICDAEEVKVDLSNPDVREGLKVLVEQSHGDMRAALNSLETVINQNKEVTPQSLVLIQKPKNVAMALQKAVGGDFLGAKELVTNLYIEEGSDATRIVEQLYDAIDTIADDEVKLRLYSKLGEVDRGCALIRVNPLIQLVDFVAYAWVAPRLMRCPALEREK